MSLNIVRSYRVYRHFQQYFRYIVAIRFICGENRSTRGEA